MDIKNFSKDYFVRKLNKDDIHLIYNLCIENEQYYKYCPPFVSKESIIYDMDALPDGKNLSDKYYIGYFKNDILIAIMDIIDNYPESNIVFIGFFMMNKYFQNRGIGVKIINDLCVYLSNIGYRYIRLGFVEGNKQAEKFWKKNNFKETKEIKKKENYNIVVMSRNL